MDLKELKEQVKYINELKEAQMSLLDTESRSNRELKRLLDNRKRYLDVVTTLTDVYGDLIDKEEDLRDEVRNISSNMKELLKSYEDYNLELKNLLANKEALEKSNIKEGEQYNKIVGEIKKYEDRMKNIGDMIKKYKEQILKTGTSFEEIKDKAYGLREGLMSLHKLEVGDVDQIMDINEYIERRKNLIEDIYKREKELGLIDQEEFNILKEQAKSIDFAIDSEYQYYTLVKKISKEEKEILDNLVRKVKENKKLKSVEGAMIARKGEITVERFRAVRGLFDPGATLEGRIKAATTLRELGQEYKTLNKLALSSGKGLAFVNTAFKGLGIVLKGLGPLGIIAVVIQGIMQAVKSISEMDKFLKQFNKTFAKLQGPTVFMRDISKSMKVFTDSIFNLNRQLTYGLKSEDIMNMFRSVSEAGMSLQGIVSRVSGGYGALIEEAAKIHLNYGVAMEEAGSMLGEQMMDLRATIDDVVDSFKVLSYDAAKAGIQSQKFYQATYAAAEALSYYGNFLTAASSALKDFQEKGAMGFKDAQKQMQETIELFKNMDKSTVIAFMEMSGGIESYREEFKKLAQESQKQIEIHNKNLERRRIALREAVKLGDEEVINRIKGEIEAEEKMLSVAERRYAQASSAARSDAQDMALYIDMLSDKTLEKMGKFFSNIRKEGGPDIFKDTRAAVEYMKTIMGVSDDFARKMIDTMKGMKESARRVKGEFAEMFKQIPTEGERSEARKELLDVIKKGIKDGRMDMKAIEEGVEIYATSKGLDTNVIMQYLDKFPTIVMDLLDRGFSVTEKELEEITFRGLKPVEKITGETAKEEKDRLDDLVKNTSTIEELLEINKEYARYVIASSDPMKWMAEGIVSMERSTGSILHEVEKIRKGQKGGMTSEEFKTSNLFKELEDIFAKELILKKRLETAKGEEKEKIEKQLENLGNLKYLKGRDYQHLYHEVLPGAERKAKLIVSRKEALEKEIEPLERERMLSSVEDRLEIDKRIKELRRSYDKKYKNIAPLEIKPFKPEKDYKAITSGYALLSKGDVVINARNLSKGIGGDYGEFTSTGISELLRGIRPADKVVTPNIPVNITIGSVNGDPEEFLKKIKPAIEQAFERMFFEKQKRK